MPLFCDKGESAFSNLLNHGNGFSARINPSGDAPRRSSRAMGQFFERQAYCTGLLEFGQQGSLHRFAATPASYDGIVHFR